MKQSFSNFYKKSLLVEGIAWRIPHVEDLEVEEFVDYLERLDSMTATQKLDGSNLKAGLDAEGNFFTTRELDGGDRWHTLKDYPRSSVYDGWRAAHACLEKCIDTLKTVLSPGEAFNLEIMYGPQPNTVFYGDGSVNFIAILEMLPGDDPTVPVTHGKTKKLVDALSQEEINVQTMASDTADGETIVSAPKTTCWRITTPTELMKERLKEVDFSEELNALRKFLRSDNAKAREMGKDLTNFEVTKDRTRDLADERKELEDKILNDYKLPIKKILLGLVSKTKATIKGDADKHVVDPEGAYTGIEGLIFTDPKTQEKFKVVDRDDFSKANKFNYQVRNAVASHIFTSDPEYPLASRGGLVGEARIRAMKLLGIPGAEVPSQAKRVIEKFKGETREETLKNLMQTLHQLNFEAIRRKQQAIYVSCLDDLADALMEFRKNCDDYELKLDNGKVIKYTPEVKRRTLLAFAEARYGILTMIKAIRKAEQMEGLIEVFYGKQLDQLNGRKK